MKRLSAILFVSILVIMLAGCSKSTNMSYNKRSGSYCGTCPSCGSFFITFEKVSKKACSNCGETFDISIDYGCRTTKADRTGHAECPYCGEYQLGSSGYKKCYYCKKEYVVLK